MVTKRVAEWSKRSNKGQRQRGNKTKQRGQHVQPIETVVEGKMRIVTGENNG